MPEIHEVATLTSKGQITLPKSIRQALGVDTGGKVAFDLRGGEVVVTRADADRITARLRETAPARCRLRSIRADAGHRFAYGDGLWTYGAAVSFGSIYHYGDDDG